MMDFVHQEGWMAGSAPGKAQSLASYRPPLIETACGPAPVAPRTPEDAGLDPSLLSDLALKLLCTVPHFTTDWAAEQLRLPLQLVESLLWQLKQAQFVEILGQTGEFGYRYAATDRGRQHAQRLMEICGYIGPAPVSLEAYTAMLEWQIGRRPRATLDAVRKALAPLVLGEETVQVAALASASGRSLFLFGPPGNGKTSLGQLLHQIVSGDLWIPHSVSVGANVIRIFDAGLHQALDEPHAAPATVDHRWVRIRPPFVVAGGEMTIAELDLAYSPSLRFYEAPPHLKANGGTFLIDDFGRQRVAPHELLNRWIIPLERQVDHLTLCTGQKITVPFRLMLIVATNLNVSEVADPAFLRRMGYRLHLDRPSPQVYEAIFNRYARQAGVEVPATVLPELLGRYRDEQRDLRASEPRDLIERARDICIVQQRSFALESDVLSLAWRAYFGQAAVRTD